MGFTKLDETILQSSIMAARPKTFKVWIALLAACDSDGVARVSETFLSRVCYLSLSDVRKALEELSSPDLSSRTPDKEGRRIEKVEGGYLIINYQKYRKAYSETPGAIRFRRWYGKKNKKEALDLTQPNVRNVRSNVEAEAEAEYIETEYIENNNTLASTPKKSSKPTPIVFNVETRSWENITNEDIALWEKAYPACDITTELSKMASWLIANPEKKKKNYRRFITNWLSRTQERGGSRGGKQMTASRVGEHKEKYNYPPGYWEKFRELTAAGLSGKELMKELKKLFPEYYKNFGIEDEEGE